MKTKLTLQEKLKDLRSEKGLGLVEASDGANISRAALQRIENDEDIRASYQDVAALALFYGVSTDYLFGITDNRQHRHIEIDALALSDSAIETLKSKRLNNRLVSELLSHEDFGQLLNAVEVYIDKKLLPHMNTMNAYFKLAESTLKENYDVAEDDEVMAFLQNSVIDEDEFLRYRISERFNAIMTSLFNAHRKDALPEEQSEVIEEMKEMVETYLAASKDQPTGKAKAIMLCKRLGLNPAKLTDEDWPVLMKVLESSPLSRPQAGKGSKKKKRK